MGLRRPEMEIATRTGEEGAVDLCESGLLPPVDRLGPQRASP